MRKLGTVFGAALLVLLIAAPAFAHVTVQPNEAVAGSFARFVVRVPNERDDASTTKVEVQFPDNVTFASFQPKEGWERTVQMKTLDEPIELFGEEITEVIGSVTWEGGEIGPGEFEEFGFSVRVPDEPAQLSFPAVQTYDSGEEVAWIGEPDSDEPAPVVTTVDLGAPEGQGELGVLADLSQAGGQADAGGGDVAGEAPAARSGLVTLAVVLAALGLIAGLAALYVALRSRPTAGAATAAAHRERTPV